MNTTQNEQVVDDVKNVTESTLNKKTKKVKVKKKRSFKKILVGIVVGFIAFVFAMFIVLQLLLATGQQKRVEEIRDALTTSTT